MCFYLSNVGGDIMTEKEKEQLVYERIRRYRRAKSRADSEDFLYGALITGFVMFLIWCKIFGF